MKKRALFVVSIPQVFLLIFSLVPYLTVGQNGQGLFGVLPSTKGSALTPLKNRIMPLGASRVDGCDNLCESYRYELWQLLNEEGWAFNFIGTQSDERLYPPQNNSFFDSDHEGRSGCTSQEIADSLESWLFLTGSPQIVLFSSPGGNDILLNTPYHQILSNIISIIETFQSNNPDVTIIIEQMAPAHSDLMSEEIKDQIEKLKIDLERLATFYSTASSKVIAVDMYSGFQDDYLADDLHYNAQGARFIAQKYYHALRSTLVENSFRTELKNSIFETR